MKKSITKNADDCILLGQRFLSVTGDIIRGFKFYCALSVIVIMLCSLAMPVFASETTNDPLTVINNLSDFVFGLIRAVGMITLGFGIVQVGLSLKSHDPSQRANGFLTLAGGVVITFAKEILNLITGG